MENIIAFLLKASELKKLKRAGWVRQGIPNPESVADHSFMTALLAYSVSDELAVNKEKLITMALIHDLAESITGDITPHDENWKTKHEEEEKAMQQLAAMLGKPEILEVWQELEEGKTAEAQLVHELDKMEMALQAFDYEKEHKINLDEFWSNTDQYIKNNIIRQIFESLKKERKWKK